MNTEKNKNAYILPSQRLITASEELKNAGTPMGAVDFSIMISLAILDKLEEVTLLLRQARP